MTFDRNPFGEAVTVAIAIARHAPAADGAGDELNDLADARALPGPVVAAGRSFVTEAREELADARNYLVWQHHVRRLDGASAVELAAIERSIAAIAVAWQHLDQVPA